MKIHVRIRGVLYPSADARSPMHLSQVRWSAGRRGPRGIVIAPQARTRYDAERLLAIGVHEGLAGSLRRSDPRVQPLEPLEFEVIEEGVTDVLGRLLDFDANGFATPRERKG